MERAISKPYEVLKYAVQILANRYPEADSAFVAGSLVRGEGSATSDIDLVVLYAALPQAYRESFLFEDIPVEAFVHDPETLSWFLEQDRKDGRPALISMLVEGALIGRRQEAGLDFKDQARKMFAEGPPPLSADALLRLRYSITDKLDDLEADRSASERIAIGAALYPLLVELALRGSNRWNGSGKWHARLLREMDGVITEQFERAFLDLYDGLRTHSVIQLADGLLAPHGGRLFSGYRSDAPAGWRSPVANTEPE
jgi:predicted nucleotidyltransferase